MAHDIEHDEILLQESELRPIESVERGELLLVDGDLLAVLQLHLPLLRVVAQLFAGHKTVHGVRTPVPLASTLTVGIGLQLLGLLP